jgi:hypothetical protein
MLVLGREARCFACVSTGRVPVDGELSKRSLLGMVVVAEGGCDNRNSAPFVLSGELLTDSEISAQSLGGKRGCL